MKEKTPTPVENTHTLDDFGDLLGGAKHVEEVTQRSGRVRYVISGTRQDRKKYEKQFDAGNFVDGCTMLLYHRLAIDPTGELLADRLKSEGKIKNMNDFSALLNYNEVVEIAVLAKALDNLKDEDEDKPKDPDALDDGDTPPDFPGTTESRIVDMGNG